MGAVTIGSLALLSLSSPGRRAEPTNALADTAAAALREARAAGADARAPMTLELAGASYASGLHLARRQELRAGWRRDYSEAARLFEAAKVQAESARLVSRREAGRERRTVMGSIEAARAVVTTLDGVEEVVWVSRDHRRRLQTARSLLASANALASDGAHQRGAARATEALALAAPVRTAVHEATARFHHPASLVAWRRSIDQAVRWSRDTGEVAIVVLKDEHEVIVYQGGRERARFHAELGWNNIGDKRTRGDGAVPEGRYHVSAKKGRAATRYHRALLLDYPNEEDLRRLEQMIRAGDVPRGTQAGGLIEIHGEGGRGRDWTDGCVALTNAEMDIVFDLASIGTPVTIVGSGSGRGTFSEVARRVAPR